MQRLHDLAPHYWNKPETADCTLVIPMPNCRRADVDLDASPRISLRLHRAYLCAKSTFLRGLLCGVSPLILNQSSSPTRSKPPRIPRHLLPRILPSTASRPVIFLPLPDPSSIQFLLHWMYFGNTDFLENALDKGEIKWDGLVRNVEYLGLTTDIKVFLGRWYRSWFLPTSHSTCLVDDDDDDTMCEDEESEDDDWDSDGDIGSDSDDDERSQRGRTLGIKRLGI